MKNYKNLFSFLICSALLTFIGYQASDGSKVNEESPIATSSWEDQIVDAGLKNSTKPNVIYILVDDLGYGDVKSLNPDSKIATPNMDKVVSNGVHFTDAHSNSSVCTPTRYGLLTGCYAFRTRLQKGVLRGYSAALIEQDQTTVGTFLKDHGYETACIGKWHLGLDWPKTDESKEIEEELYWRTGSNLGNTDDNVDYQKYISGGASDHGFDYSLIIPGSLDMSPYLYIRNGYAVEEPTLFTQGKKEKLEGRGMFWRRGKISPSFDFKKVLPTVIDSAIYYIHQHARTEAPFFLYLPLPAPHLPWLPADEFVGTTDVSGYGDYVAMVDAMIGKVVNQIYSDGIEQETLIIISSDNGSDWRPSDIKKTGHYANAQFRGRKADIYEGGHRIPYFAQWEGVIPAGHQSDELICTTDLLATMAGLLNTTLTNKIGVDSYDLWPAYLADVKEPIRSSVIHHSQQGFFSLRKGKWKYTQRLGSGGFSSPSVIQPKEGEATGTLFDMEVDPEEKNNLYLQHQDIVLQLDKLLEQQKAQGFTRKITGL
ncbi:MAG: sulfatase-like hydrolase/transferase [Cyclobacteriaceae bacterium]